MLSYLDNNFSSLPQIESKLPQIETTPPQIHTALLQLTTALPHNEITMLNSRFTLSLTLDLQ